MKSLEKDNTHTSKYNIIRIQVRYNVSYKINLNYSVKLMIFRNISGSYYHQYVVPYQLKASTYVYEITIQTIHVTIMSLYEVYT